MTDFGEPPSDRGQRMIGYTALGYAVATLLLLGFCCYGAYWTNQTIIGILGSH
jgi:hypothetical protein